MPVRYAIYLLRWQLSTPILAFCVVYFNRLGGIWSTVLANLIGGLIFFWIDGLIFRSRVFGPVWEVREDIRCADCGNVGRGYRLVRSGHYDRTGDENPQYRCEACSSGKTRELRARGVVTQ